MRFKALSCFFLACLLCFLWGCKQQSGKEQLGEASFEDSSMTEASAEDVPSEAAFAEGTSGLQAQKPVTGTMGDNDPVPKAIRIAIEQTDSFAPWNVSSRVTADFLSLLYEPLWTQKEDGHLELLLADSVSIDPQGEYADIHLKEGILFHDGTTLDAADICFSVQMLRSRPNVYSSCVSSIRDTLVVDYYTVRLYPEQSLYPAIYTWTFPVFPDELGASAEPDGTGPYRWDASDGRREISLCAFEAYHGAAPKTGTVKVTILHTPAQEASAVSQAFQAGLTNLFHMEEADPKAYAYMPEYTICSWISDEAVFLEFAASGPGQVLSNRQKICQSIDTDRVLRDAVYGFGVKTHLPVRPGAFYSGASSAEWQDAFPYDPSFAMQIEMVSTASSFRILYDPADAVLARAAESILSQLEKAGVSVQLVTYGGWDAALRRSRLTLEEAASMCGSEEMLTQIGSEEELETAAEGIALAFTQTLDFRPLFYLKEGVVLGPGLSGTVSGNSFVPYLGAQTLY